MGKVNLSALTPAPAKGPKRRQQQAATPRPAAGRKQMTMYVPVSAWRQLRRIAFEEERSIHSCLLEGLDLMFAKRGLQSVERLAGERKPE